MNNNYFYQLAFKLKLMESEGNCFQDLFGTLMRSSHPGYRDVSSLAFKGDGGNDGWIEDEGAYYQVYGPQVNSENPEKTAVKKAKDDFEKLKKNWDQIVPIRKYFFVFNSRLKPISADLQKIMVTIKNEVLRGFASKHDTLVILASFIDFALNEYLIYRIGYGFLKTPTIDQNDGKRGDDRLARMPCSMSFLGADRSSCHACFS
jgi:hypothetical protein